MTVPCEHVGGDYSCGECGWSGVLYTEADITEAVRPYREALEEIRDAPHYGYPDVGAIAAAALEDAKRPAG